MSAYTAMLAELGHVVTGSDVRDHPRLDRLRLLGVECSVPQRAENLPDGLDAVVISSAVPETNVEVARRRARGIPVLRRAEVLAAIVATPARPRGRRYPRQDHDVIDDHADPARGRAASELPHRQRAARGRGRTSALDSGEWLVVEADESDGTFLELPLEAALVTNVDNDHLWFWGDIDQLRAAFARFVGPDRAAPGAVHRRPGARRSWLGRAIDAVTYGLDAGARYRAVDYHGGPDGSRFVLERRRRHARRDPAAGDRPSPRAERGRGGGDDHGARVRLRGGAAGARPASVAWPGASSTAARSDGVAIVDDYALLPPEVQRHDRRRARSRLPAGRRGVPAVPLRPDRGDVGGVRGCVRRRGSGDPHRRLRVPRVDRSPASPVTCSSGRCSMPTPTSASRTSRTGRELADLVPAYARSGDVILTLGGGDITTLGDELVARTPRAMTARDELATLGVAARRRAPGSRRRWTRPSGRSPPGAWAGRPRSSSAPRHPPTLETVGRLLEPAVPRLVLGRGSNLLVADAGYRRRGRRARPRVRDRVAWVPATSTRVRPRRSRCWRVSVPPRDGRVWVSTSASPDRWAARSA